VSRPTVAVVGAGVAGLTAAYLLQRQFDVTLFEAEPRLGGHAHTHEILSPDGRVLPIDSGFIVCNDRTYPHLLRLFDELGVETQPTEMSFSVRCDGCGLEYAGARGLGGLFADARRSTSPTFVRMLVEVKKLHRRARRLLDAHDDTMTLGEFLTRGRFSPYFEQHLMVPLVSCVWSCAPRTALEYPAQYLFQFLDHHGMLSVNGTPQWRTVVGGSRTYVERAAKELTATETSAPVTSVRRIADGIEICNDVGTRWRFDRAVVATHADHALGILVQPSDAERSVLGAFEYSTSDTVLHTDASLLPRRPRARASWNYLLDDCSNDVSHVQVSYHMNRLQRLDAPLDYVVTLNGSSRLREDSVLARMSYAHPIYTPTSVAAQARLSELNDGRIAFAGAYQGWGFHEDGCASGVRAAASLGVTW